MRTTALSLAIDYAAAVAEHNGQTMTSEEIVQMAGVYLAFMMQQQDVPQDVSQSAPATDSNATPMNPIQSDSDQPTSASAPAPVDQPQPAPPAPPTAPVPEPPAPATDQPASKPAPSA